MIDLWRVRRRLWGGLGGARGSIFEAKKGADRVLLSASYKIAIWVRFGVGFGWILGGFGEEFGDDFW